MDPSACKTRLSTSKIIASSVVLLFAIFFNEGIYRAADTGLDRKISAIHETPNWRFVTREFIERIEKRQANLQGPHVNLFGTLQDVDGNVVRDAFVLLRVKSASSLFRADYSGETGDVFATTWSDKNGFFAFEKQPTPWYEPAYPVGWQLLVFAPGKCVKFVDYNLFDPKPKTEILTLEKGYTIKGNIIDVDGQPVTHIPFAVYELVDPYDGADIKLSFLDSDCLTSVLPDNEGAIIYGGLPESHVVTVLPKPLSFALQEYHNRLNVATSVLNKGELYPQKKSRSALVYPYSEVEFKQQFKVTSDVLLKDFPGDGSNKSQPYPKKRTRKVSIIIVDAFSGKPVSGIGVGFTRTKSLLERISCKIGMPITNEEGKTQIEIPLNADAFVYSTGRRYGYVTHQTRLSADPNEYLPPIQDGEWWKQIESGEQDCEIRFECRPVSPLEVNVTDTAGNPVEATVEVTNAAWATQATVWWAQSDSSGRLTIPLRPVVFKVNIEAKTEDGRSGRVDNFELSKDFERVETVQIKVK